jgi:hypothetical protein
MDGLQEDDISTAKHLKELIICKLHLPNRLFTAHIKHSPDAVHLWPSIWSPHESNYRLAHEQQIHQVRRHSDQSRQRLARARNRVPQIRASLKTRHQRTLPVQGSGMWQECVRYHWRAPGYVEHVTGGYRARAIAPRYSLTLFVRIYTSLVVGLEVGQVYPDDPLAELQLFVDW